MTTRVIDELFYLCRLHLYKDLKEKNEEFKISDAEAVRQLISLNGMTVFLYKQIKELHAKYNCFDLEYIKSLDGYVQHKIMTELAKYRAIRIIVAEAKKRDIKLIFFKGLLIADLYPQYAERYSSDSDILVDESQKENAEKLLVDCGYERLEDECKKHVQVYKNRNFSHVVELHTRLWEDYEGPKIEALKKMELSSDKTNIQTKACGIDVCTLGVHQHLVYQLFHIIKHFSLDGIGIRYLVDITLFVNRYFDEIDFNTFWKQMDTLGYTKFVEAFFKICISELDMTDKVFDGHKVSFRGDEFNLKTDLLNVGNILSKDAGWQIMGAMEAYFTGDVAAPDTKFKRQMSMMFPSAKALPKVYGYAIKFPILLPFAWIHRGVKFLIKKQFHKDDFYGVREKIDVAEHRLRLIEELGLTIEKE